MSPGHELATGDFFEAAFLRALGARLVRIDDGAHGVAVLDVRDVTPQRLRDAAAALTREIERVADSPSPSGLRGLYDNSFVGAMRGHFHVIRGRFLRG